MKSLQFRLSVALFISLISVFAALWWLTGVTLRYLAEEYLTEHLQHDAESIVNALHIDANGNISVNPEQVEPIYQRPDSGQYFSIISAKSILRSPSLQQFRFDIPPIEPGEIYKKYQTGPNRKPLLIQAQNHLKQGVPVTVVTAEDLSDTLQRIAFVQRRYSLVAALLLMLLIGIQVAILRSGFHPLKRIRNQLYELEQGKRQALDTDVPTEVTALVTEVNRLLQILQQRLQRSRNTLSDLAHALKTPLSVIQQLSHEQALKQHPELSSMLQTQTSNMQRMMDRVLKRGRLAGLGPATQDFDAVRELNDLADTLKIMYRDKCLNIILHIAPEAKPVIDREDLLELAGNLLDNACKWARSEIRVSFTANGQIRLVVEDDGPGVTDNECKLLSKRGRRLDESVTGYGLGLAIAHYITDQYHGSLNFGRSRKLGGFCITAVLRLNAH